ncbi:COX15/CtaA family protein [Thermomonas mangrovi]|uniref:COX15/CtaA family protein n=1 Tax=Thermomonas mangrovi TaxID=2993316 RepID=UPI002307E3BE|nr:COX15/CtaA family protein [Thermomonas mangrovi]
MNNPASPAPVAPAKGGLYRHFHRIAWLAVALATCVIVFGAFVRLSNAGLSCPDWPTCYGMATWPTTPDHASAADHAATAIRPIEPSKAWREQFHRIIAGLLGVLVLALALLATRRRPQGWLQVIGAAVLVAIAIPLYMRGQHVAASVLAIAGELALLAGVLRWSDTDLARTSTLTLAVIIFQALLGMWTVTWLLKPVVVMGHLLGGLTTFSLLTWIAWRATGIPIRSGEAGRLRRLLLMGLVLLAIQIALGGWTSANYAALACGTDFPKCAGQWWPAHDFREGFVLWRGIGVDYEGGILDNEARIAIQLAHRLMALVVVGHLLALAARLLRSPGLRGWGTLLGALVLLQFGLGIANVVMSLPLHVAVTHNAGATALLFVLVTLLARLRAPDA